MAQIVPVYFGNGCFWGRQFDYVSAEQRLGRSGADLSAVVGYAGGRAAPPPEAGGRVCYYSGKPGTGEARALAASFAAL